MRVRTAAGTAVAALAAILALAGCASTSHQQSMAQSYAYKYGKILGSMAYIQTMEQDGKAEAAAGCQASFGGITRNFVPASDLAEFPQWKDKRIKQHPGWFFLGLKAGCQAH